MKYAKIIESVCGDNWMEASPEEQDGGYGVACVLAVMKGVKPKLEDLSRHLDVSVEELAQPYKRLLYSGVLSKNFDPKNDPALLCEGFNYGSMHLEGWTIDDAAKTAWAHIAAVAGGLIERNIPNVTKFSS